MDNLRRVCMFVVILVVQGCGFNTMQNVRIDPMTGEKSARFSVNAAVETRYGRYKIISLYFSVKKTGAIVCALGHDFPGREARIRIDNDQPISLGDAGCISMNAALSRRFSESKIVRVEAYSFPSNHPLIGDVKMGFYAEKIRWAKNQVGIKTGNNGSGYTEYSDDELTHQYYKQYY